MSSPPAWVRAAGAVAVLVIALVIVLVAAGEQRTDVAAVEAQIASDYQGQLDQAAPGATVETVSCALRDEQNDGTCTATVSGSLIGTTRIDVTIGDDGSLVWQADNAGLVEN